MLLLILWRARVNKKNEILQKFRNFYSKNPHIPYWEAWPPTRSATDWSAPGRVTRFATDRSAPGWVTWLPADVHINIICNMYINNVFLKANKEIYFQWQKWLKKISFTAITIHHIEKKGPQINFWLHYSWDVLATGWADYGFVDHFFIYKQIAFFLTTIVVFIFETSGYSGQCDGLWLQ